MSDRGRDDADAATKQHHALGINYFLIMIAFWATVEWGALTEYDVYAGLCLFALMDFHENECSTNVFFANMCIMVSIQILLMNFQFYIASGFVMDIKGCLKSYPLPDYYAVVKNDHSKNYQREIEKPYILFILIIICNFHITIGNNFLVE